ncbi:anthranilate phosphoribosyltransferase [Brevibacterium sp. 91QC2O2]|uniref:anthranilate phosphoribosyltransferase n=1 Tax=Brevibacterium TaxID=1696 RepID=UPI00211CA2F4|nr:MULTISPECIES: anthranilate phosphoribosyltransferase [unclassified Brevibacterium]MCQ9366691.1 anthranilate phosphoribosyltransferase [Brevibacterium sp. 91QC2O2]MCQ9384332.1 anthranilate phosphoribosyltransferase [Brevibacterium sp. 68QC2CO]
MSPSTATDQPTEPTLREVRDWSDLLVGLMAHHDMDRATSAWAMDQIMSGVVPDVTMAAFLVAHHGKGETVEEISGLVEAMMEHAVELPGLSDSVDIVGTGGDRAKTVNISSTSSFVIAAQGTRVVKHGNRATSSASGSADVLERLGLVLDLTPEQTVELAHEVGMAFCFANVYHPAMRFIAPVRKQIAVPSAFNILGPLTNPAHTRATAIGVADPAMAPLVAGTLAARGDTAVVFRSRDGLDELSNTAPNDVWEVRGGNVEHSVLDATELGLPRVTKEDLRGGDPAFNASVMRRTLAGEESPVRDAVLLNAAAALVAFDRDAGGSFADRLSVKIESSRRAIDSGAAAGRLEALVDASQRIAARG